MNSPETGGELDGLPSSAADVFDAAWEARSRKSMEPTGWDGELAIRAARDALAVVAGDLTEDEFRARHHEAYLREFGVDLRPVESASEEVGPSGVDEALPLVAAASAEGDSPGGAAERPARPAPVSRRSALTMAGGGIAAVMLAEIGASAVRPASADEGGRAGTGDHPGGVSSASGSHGASGKVRMGMVLDLDRCDGCLMCVSACKKAYGLPDGVHWLYVLAYKEPERPDDINLLVRPCQHCANAPCVKVCPTGARHRRDDGLVLTNYDVCFGCRYCQVACPYGVNYFGWSEANTAGGGFEGNRRDARGKSVIGAPPRGVMGKCIFDPQRQDSDHTHESTHCQMACPMGVIHFGNMNDPESEPNVYLRKRIEESGGKLSTFRLLEELGTEPNVTYIGHRPSRRAEATPGPTRYEDWGFVDERRIVLEGPDPWFKRVFKR